MQYIFILGNNPELSLAEIRAVRPDLKLLKNRRSYAVFSGEIIDCQKLLNRLGGTIKIGEKLGERIAEAAITEAIKNHQGEPASTRSSRLARAEADIERGEGRVNFGFSCYNLAFDRRSALAIKKKLKADGINSRLVESREKALSSVIVIKEKVWDFLITSDGWGLTKAVQDFKDYGQRDRGRPKADARSGMLPTKLAKIMINLSGLDAAKQSQAVLLDPFCGSGTILTEALALGFTNLMGCDLAQKAVDDTRENLEWQNKFSILNFQSLDFARDKLSNNFQLFNLDVRKLSSKIAAGSVGAIITEPYLGKPLRGGESKMEIKKIASQLADLYLASFREFKKILKTDGKVVIVFPQWHLGNEIYDLDIFSAVKSLGFNRLDAGDLVYKREGQRVWRVITVWKKL